MNLEQLGKRDARLAGLLQQSQQWRRLDAAVKRILPANLHPHFQTACIEEGRLVLLAANGMAASRLKMILPALVPQLQDLNAGIRDVAGTKQPSPPRQPTKHHPPFGNANRSKVAQSIILIQKINPYSSVAKLFSPQKV